MGWDVYIATEYKSNGTVDRKTECDNYLTHDCRCELVRSAMVGSVYYAAARESGKPDVWAAVFLTHVNGNEFACKAIDETMLPYEHKCPKSILVLLTPTDNKYANTWRENCWAYHKKANSPKAFKNLNEGQKAVWTVPHDRFIGLSKGDKVVMTKSKVNRGKRCVWLLDNQRCYISAKHIDQDDYELV